jgi:hypothetical protein
MKEISMPKKAEIHETTAMLLTFAEPPAASKHDVAQECVGAGLIAIGINPPYKDSDPVDFGAISRQNCIAFGQTIELCVDGKGFEVDGLPSAFRQLHDGGNVVLFGNLVKAVTNLMVPKS